MDPPVEEGEEGASAGVGQGGAAGGGEVAGGGKGGETLVDGAGEMALAEFHDVADFFGGGHGGNELAHIGDVGEELLDGRDAIGRVVVANEGSREHFEEVFDVAEEEIVFVAVVSVEGGAADFGAIEDVLDGDGLEGLFVHEGDESVAEVIAGGANATIGFLFDWREGNLFLCRGPVGGWPRGCVKGFWRGRRRVSGHWAALCSVSRRVRRIGVDGPAKRPYCRTHD
jgi:hypothetical protein